MSATVGQAFGAADSAPRQGREGAVIRLVLAPVRLYQQWVSPALPRRCRYYPTCSAYAVQAVRTHGPLKGLVLVTWRLLRCNPFTRGGVDHVPEPGQWRYHYPHDVPRPETATS